MKPQTMTKIVNRKRYSTVTATLIAHDAYWDGHNWERHGRNRYLYRTPKGAYFLVTQTRWEGESDTLDPISLDDAIMLYEGPLTEHEEQYGTAFPGVEIQDA